MELPLILVCFKSEPMAFGKNAESLAAICQSVSEKHGVAIGISPNILDLRNLAERFSIPTFAQHFHPVDMVKNTGHIPAEALKLAGASGVIINHAEKPLTQEGIEERVCSARNLGLTSIVCCKSPEEASAFAAMGPDFISYEPPEFIGSTKQSVSTARPVVLQKAVSSVSLINSSVQVLCGAGVASNDDVRIALALGVSGFMVSTAVVKADDPVSILEGFCRTIKNYGQKHGSGPD